MEKSISIADPASASAAIKRRFLELNQERLCRAQESMRERQKDFIDLVPLLFHVNHPILPGFVSSEGPVGISDYRPTERALQAAKKIAVSFDHKRKALPRYDIYALYMMGSSGTIAYSYLSDFDIWVCYRPDLHDTQVLDLQRKATLLEEWAASLDLKVHFFLINPEHFKEGRHADLSTESSGTAQHYLLLEEFYRTGLLLAGRYPAWWLVPPDQEEHYDACIETLLAGRYITRNEYMDFGAVAQIPTEEFFGAALWQLFKGIDSPYKSVLKLLLMEIYVSQHPHIALLCHRFKRAIYDGETKLDRLDPYIMLLQNIEEYLSGGHDLDRLDFVRRCFYFKVNERLSASDHPSQMNWRRKLMRNLTKTWGWGDVYLEMLDSRLKWKVNRVSRERKILVQEFTHCYKTLSHFARKHAGLASINEKDMTILGRKLYAAFERKAGKVEIINRGVSDDLWEGRISLQQFLGRDGQEMWSMSRGIAHAGDLSQHALLKQGRTVCELVIWGYCNGLIDERTLIMLQAQSGDLSQRELSNMTRAFQRLFPLAQIMETDVKDLARPAHIVNAALFINVGLDPMQQYTRQGNHLITTQTDAFNYGGLAENLALTFDQILLTSWKEVLTFHHRGVGGLFTCIGEYLQWAPPSGGTPPPLPSCCCFSSPRGESISKRIKDLFQDIVHCHYGRDALPTTRYLIAVEQTYYILFLENDLLRYSLLGSYDKLLVYVGQPSAAYSPLVIDRHTLKDTLLPLIFQINRMGVIQLVYQVEGEAAEVFVIDERGSLFHQQVNFIDRVALMDHFSVFFESVVKRQHYSLSLDRNDVPTPEVEFYEAGRDGVDGRRLTRVNPAAERRVKHYFKVQVIGEADKDGNPHYTIYCNDEEFTGLAYGEQMFSAVAAYVLGQRRSGLRYPIYITDIDLPRTLFGGEPGGRVQTIHFLNYKKQIEERLNAALQTLAQSSA